MSREAWGDEGDVGDGFTDERTAEIGKDNFLAGAMMMREMLARFVEQGGDSTTAQSIRANWVPQWGDDPGKPSGTDYDRAMNGIDPFDWS